MAVAVVRPKSLLFVAATVVLVLALTGWVWSYAGTAYLDQGRLLVIHGDSGEIVDAVYTEADIHNRDEAHARLARADGWYSLRKDVVRSTPGAYQEGFGGFGLGRLTVPGAAGAIWLVAVPLWSVAAPAGLLTFGLTLGSARTWRRVADGKCAACGYDLRGSAGRCPECGTAPAGTVP